MAWYGYPYEDLPRSLKQPVVFAIIGGILGVVAAVLTSASPLILGLGLGGTGAVIGGILMSLTKGGEWRKNPLLEADEEKALEQEISHRLDINPLQPGTRFRELVSTQKDSGRELLP
jgi:hypothetical protein